MNSYIFGTSPRGETLKTVSDEHTDLTGRQQIVREYPDCKITDNFVVKRKYHSAEDGEGNCYDWYDITEHYRTEDRTGPILEMADTLAALVLEQQSKIILLEMGVST